MQNKKTIIITLFVFGIISVFLAPFIGSVSIPFKEVFNSEIFLNIRLPRVAFAFIVGFSLSMIGVIFQALLRNDLATPYTLGVSSGGALGAVISIKSGLSIAFLGFTTTAIFSIVGSVFTIFIIYWIAKNKIGISPVTLVLTGVTVSLFFSSMILFIHYIADFTETYRMIRWLMGGLQITGWNYSIILFPFAILIFLFFYINSNAFNIMSAGRDLALSKGVNVESLQKYSFFGGSILIGLVVAFAGPIGFIGLIIPHLMRLIFGPDHKILLVTAALFGGIFLVWCDTIA
ncbi:MAG: iron ABC transporter permease, partial [Calditrichia bacterium]|nr:iron ABC transporter permease [Calditrichia bacterium]